MAASDVVEREGSLSLTHTDSHTLFRCRKEALWYVIVFCVPIALISRVRCSFSKRFSKKEYGPLEKSAFFVLNLAAGLLTAVLK